MHTEANPPGEIRGTIDVAPADQVTIAAETTATVATIATVTAITKTAIATIKSLQLAEAYFLFFFSFILQLIKSLFYN